MYENSAFDPLTLGFNGPKDYGTIEPDRNEQLSVSNRSHDSGVVETYS